MSSTGGGIIIHRLASGGGEGTKEHISLAELEYIIAQLPDGELKTRLAAVLGE